MNVQDILDRLDGAVHLASDDVAIRVHAEYAPQAGSSAKVSPPTYMSGRDGRYHLEKRWGDNGDEIDVVVMDSIQSQANRAERALRDEAGSLGIPHLVMRAELADRSVTVTSFDAPHRSRDAYFLDSEQDGTAFDKTEAGTALGSATAEDATAFLRHAPHDLVYGVWDSHRGKRMPTKFPRVVTSEMLGWHVLRGKRAATKGDPLNLPGNDKVPFAEWRPDIEAKKGKQAQVDLNKLGHGMIPVPPDDDAGGVSVRRITRTAVISLTALAALRFPGAGEGVDRPARVALATLALLGDRLAFARGGLNLRSGADLVLASERVEWVRLGAQTEPLDLNVDAARALFVAARDRLAAVGLRWDPKPVMLEPSARLKAIIERTFYVPQLDDMG